MPRNVKIYEKGDASTTPIDSILPLYVADAFIAKMRLPIDAREFCANVDRAMCYNTKNHHVIAIDFDADEIALHAFLNPDDEIDAITIERDQNPYAVECIEMQHEQ